MPIRFEKENIKIPRERDRRIKLNDKQREEIVEIYSSGSMSYNEIAKLYGVSKRLVYFVVNPDKLEENKGKREERGGWKQYYDKEKNRISMRKYRANKKKVLEEEGLI
jgi:transposase